MSPFRTPRPAANWSRWPHEGVDNNAPAGSINSCVADLAKWVTVQLNHGDMGSSRLFSEAQSKEMWSAQTIMPISDPPGGALAALRPNFSAYGLGWGLNDYRGKKMCLTRAALRDTSRV